MATKELLNNRIKELESELEDARNAVPDTEALEAALDIANTTIDTLEAELADRPTVKAYQKAQASPAIVVTPKPEETTKLFWDGYVNPAIGAVNKAFGHQLKQDDEGRWYADVPKSRVVGELTRSAKGITSRFTEEVDEEVNDE